MDPILIVCGTVALCAAAAVIKKVSIAPRTENVPTESCITVQVYDSQKVDTKDNKQHGRNK
jgi:hypothetical protein